MARLKSLLTRRPSVDSLPASIELHPDYVRHQVQRSALADRVASLDADVTLRTVERDALQAEQHESEIAAALGELTPSEMLPERIERIASLTVQIDASRAKAEPLREALRRLDAREPEIRAAVATEMADRIREIGEGVIGEMASLFTTLAGLNEQLQQLERYQLARLPVSSWRDFTLGDSRGPSKLSLWLRSVREAGIEL